MDERRTLRVSEAVREELIEIIGLDGVLAELNCGGMIPEEKVNRSLRLMCQEVAPRFR